MKKEFVKKLGFIPKEWTNNIFIKKYNNNYIIEIDFKNEKINYWNLISSESKTTQNFIQEENSVVLECVNRLLEKWYNPKDIILEKIFPTGHWTSWRLDILVKKEWKSFLMIECKTWWKEFEKEYKNMQKSEKNQLFTYFQQDRDTQYLILYTSNENLEYKNEIVKIEESYKDTSNVLDFYIRWNKFTKQNGIFENWIKPYNFESRALTLNDLENIKETDASFIFNRFLEILRHNTVSDKPNAFNKVFTLFLCKIHDEWTKRIDEELDFQWKEWVDNNVSFQTRLIDLYKRGMMEFLSKEITDFNDDQFNSEFWELEESVRKRIIEKITKLRLQKNNEFAIKEVFDDETFEENSIVLKEIVELLQWYRFRYTKKQPFLWDFFELLLTTWLKQESWQFFTPVPIARFICKSIPIKDIIYNKLQLGDTNDLLPSTIDYAAWSWHFLTESMEEIQNIINKIDTLLLRPNVEKELNKWKSNTFDWAWEYMYGIEKDYRLVKTAKVWCYLHWDWIATVIHWDWLDSFEFSKSYKWKLKKFNQDDKMENGQFDIVLSNPPYSVSAFKWNLKKEQAENDFELYNFLTDNSSEIESLFIERTSQLLKEWWIAWIILPSSILSNTWIYTRSREIILKNFEIIGITELWSNTFMATWTNTVVLFLKKRNKFFSKNLRLNTDKFFINFQDITLNKIENSVSKYLNDVWEWVKFSDYASLIQKNPTEDILNHELYKDYQNKIKLTKKSEQDRKKEFFEKLIIIEKEKLFYFVLTYSQQLVIVKSWDKNIEKQFLGYEFSNRKWKEWIHSIQGWKLIDECTMLFDSINIDNPLKASTYIYESFKNIHNREIVEELKNHIFRTNLSDLLTFDRAYFEKTISLNLKKKVKINSKWELVKLWDILDTLESWNRPKWWVWNIKEWVPSLWWEHIWLNWKVKIDNNIKYVSYKYFKNSNKWIIKNKDILICKDWALTWKIAIFNKSKFDYENLMINEHVFLLRVKQNNIQEYLFNYLFSSKWQELLKSSITWQAQWWLNRENLLNIKIPLPPKEIQQKIVDEIQVLEKIEENNLDKILDLEQKIEEIIIKSSSSYIDLWEIAEIRKGNSITKKDTFYWDIPVIAWWKEPSYYHNVFNRKWNIITISASWANSWFVNYFDKPIFASDCNTINSFDENKILTKLIFKFLKINQKLIYWLQRWQAQPHVYWEDLAKIKIPLISIEKQKQIVSQIDDFEKQIEKLKNENNIMIVNKKDILNKYL